MRKEILRELQNEYARQREEDDRIFFEHQEKAIAECPEIGRLIDERQNLIFSALRGMVRGEKAELVPESMERAEKRYGADRHGQAPSVQIRRESLSQASRSTGGALPEVCSKALYRACFLKP